MKSTIKLFLLLILSLTVGCGATKAPKYYRSNVSLHDSVPVRDMHNVINYALKSTFPNDDVNHNCVAKYNNDHSKKIADVCFKVMGTALSRKSTIYSDDSSLQDWFDAVISKQNIVEGYYKSITFEELHKEELNAFNNKINNLKVKFVDKTGKVSQETIDYLVRTYEVLKDFPRFAIKPYYKVKYTQLDYETNVPQDLNYQNYSDVIIFNIVSANEYITYNDINPLTKSFEMNDKTLVFEAIYDKSINHVTEINISNMTKDYITIEAISGYFNDKIKTNIISKPFSMPPMSKHTIKRGEIYFPMAVHTKARKHGNYIVATYGYSVKYQLSNNSAPSTLYKVLDYYQNIM